MSLYWWLHGKLTRRRRARNWAEGIRVMLDDAGVRWEVKPRTEFAESRAVRWEELSGIAEFPDNGAAPDGLLVLRREAAESDFLPLEAEGARALLDEARRRGLLRPLAELTAEREANERAR